jgi:hypothetical protein
MGLPWRYALRVHPTLLLALTIFGFTVVVGLLVWAQSTSWREALRAWWQFTLYLLAMAVPGIVAWAWFMVFGP